MTGVRQLAGTWIAGSAVTGTLAVIFTRDVIDPVFRIDPVIRSLNLLSPAERLSVFLLVGALFLVLLAIGWRTQEASWLPGGGRGAILWTILIGGGGLLGWGFAAVVTFAAEFSHDAQLVLAYTCGGLPFALIAGLLLRPLRANLAAGALIVVGLSIGWLLAADNEYGQNPLQLCVSYLQYLVASPVRPL